MSNPYSGFDRRILEVPDMDEHALDEISNDYNKRERKKNIINLIGWALNFGIAVAALIIAIKATGKSDTTEQQQKTSQSKGSAFRESPKNTPSTHTKTTLDSLK